MQQNSLKNKKFPLEKYQNFIDNLTEMFKGNKFNNKEMKRKLISNFLFFYSCLNNLNILISFIFNY